jgi:hypothetical protein
VVRGYFSHIDIVIECASICLFSLALLAGIILHWGDIMMTHKAGAVFKGRFFFVLTAVFALTVLTLSLPFAASARYALLDSASGSGEFALSDADGSQGGVNANALFSEAIDRLHVDLYGSPSLSALDDSQKAILGHQSEADRKTIREVESASFSVLHNLLKTYETEYIRSVTEGGKGITALSANVMEWRAALVHVLPS